VGLTAPSSGVSKRRAQTLHFCCFPLVPPLRPLRLQLHKQPCSLRPFDPRPAPCPGCPRSGSAAWRRDRSDRPGGHRHGVDLDLVRRRREPAGVGIANLVGEGHRVLRRGETGDARLQEGLEVVDGVLPEVARPLLLGPVVVVVDAKPLRARRRSRGRRGIRTSAERPASCRLHSGRRRRTACARRCTPTRSQPAHRCWPGGEHLLPEGVRRCAIGLYSAGA
jgi:hypothetical protein